MDILGADYRIVTLDLPAHGLIGGVPDGDYSTHAYVEAVKDVVDHLDLTRFIVGGYFMGGEVAWHFALSYPDLLESLILVNASGFRGWDNEVNKPLLLDLITKKWFRSIASMLDPYYLYRTDRKNCL